MNQGLTIERGLGSLGYSLFPCAVSILPNDHVLLDTEANRNASIFFTSINTRYNTIAFPTLWATLDDRVCESRNGIDTNDREAGGSWQKKKVNGAKVTHPHTDRTRVGGYQGYAADSKLQWI